MKLRQQFAVLTAVVALLIAISCGMGITWPALC